jgi:hypothetical protein
MNVMRDKLKIVIMILKVEDSLAPKTSKRVQNKIITQLRGLKVNTL